MYRPRHMHPTGLTDATLGPGLNVASSEIDNGFTEHEFLTLSLSLDLAGVPDANGTMELYLVCNTGDGYEDGLTVDPVAMPIAVMPIREVAGMQKLSFPRLDVPPYAFRVVLKSEVSVSAVATLMAKTYSIA